MTRGRQRGFTLIELMVALVVSSLLVGMILAIFSRMSLAYRGQQQIAGVQQVLAAARATIELDAKQAGLEMSQGFRIGVDGPTVLYAPVKVTDSSTGPDQIAFFYADTSAQAAVTDLTTLATTATVTVDSVAGFALGDLVVMSNVTWVDNPLSVTDAKLASYAACVLQIAPAAGSLVAGPPAKMRFTTVLPWGSVALGHCAPPPASGAMIYKFVAHGYRIDPTASRAALGALQLSPTGGLLGGAGDNWTDLAYGFTDLQTALRVFDRVYDPGDSSDADIDGDRDWYSGALQTTLTGRNPLLGPLDGLLQVSISLVARTDRDVEGIATSATPNLIEMTTGATPAPTNADHNTIGNHPAVTLPSATDAALQGSRVYRYTTFVVDFRNLGVGR